MQLALFNLNWEDDDVPIVPGKDTVPAVSNRFLWDLCDTAGIGWAASPVTYFVDRYYRRAYEQIWGNTNWWGTRTHWGAKYSLKQFLAGTGQDGKPLS